MKQRAEGIESSIQSLLNAGMDVNQRDVEGNTPLHRACAANRLDIVELLYSNGANLNAKNNRVLKHCKQRNDFLIL